MKTHYSKDGRVVMTLDAGGTSLRFSAVQGGRAATERVVLPTHADDLRRCLATIVEGFTRVAASCPEVPVALSFAAV